MLRKQSRLFYMRRQNENVSPPPSINTRCLGAPLFVVLSISSLSSSDLSSISVRHDQLQLPSLPPPPSVHPSSSSALIQRSSKRQPEFLRENQSIPLPLLFPSRALSFSFCLSSPFLLATCHLATVSAMLLGSESSLQYSSSCINPFPHN